jgi:hypothetical protein
MGSDNHRKSLAAGIGVGAVNVIFALPAFYWIDSKGRRFLLLATFPWMAIAMLWTSLAFRVDDENTRMGLVLSGMVRYTTILVYFSSSQQTKPPNPGLKGQHRCL